MEKEINIKKEIKEARVCKIVDIDEDDKYLYITTKTPVLKKT